MWFEKLVGFNEKKPNQVRENLILDGEYLISLVNKKRYKYGRLDVSTLKTLKENSPLISNYNGQIKLSEIVANVQDLHTKPENRGSVFQAASQFNLLEMVSPNVTPEQGVDIYENDYTQGPACAIACGAGTIYRNYFAPVNGKIGQTANNQIDCLEELGKALGNTKSKFWTMQNGYAFATKDGLKNISNQIKKLNSSEYETLKEKLKVGIQWNTEVTLDIDNQEVTQVYCSALPIAYSYIDSFYWKDFAQLVLEATYEATFYTALKNYTQTGNSQVFLTLVGGGAFGNEMSWIFDAIRKSMQLFKNVPLDVKIVTYGHSNPNVRAFCSQ